MTQDERWHQWFYDRHPEPTLARWACGLRVFRYCRAYGGHSNDGDQFLAALRYSDLPDLRAVLAALGCPLDAAPPGRAEQELRRAWLNDTSVLHRSVLSSHPQFLQPGGVRLAGERAWVWVGRDRVEVSLSDEDDLWDVSEAAFESARRLEALLAPLAGRIVDPPRDDRHCLCPAYHPDVFAGCR